MFSATDPGPAGEFGGCCRSPNMWRSPLNGDFQYGLIAAPMTASTEPPAPIGQLINTSQRAIYEINRDFRYGSCSLRSRLAERTTWRLRRRAVRRGGRQPARSGSSAAPSL